MTAIDRYLTELESELQVRGSARRRLLRECRDHLEDAATESGADEAIWRFGAARALAASYDAEIAMRRARRSTLASMVGVLAVGGSTLALVNGASADSPAVLLWAVVFFAGAQTAATSAVLAALQAAAMRSGPATPSDAALLGRRNACALFFAALTMFAAGAAVPGSAPAVLLLSGPALAAIAALAVLRTRSLVRRLDASGRRVTRSPLSDLGALLRRSIPDLRPSALLLLVVLLACLAAFVWDRGDHAPVSSALVVAAIEAALVVAGFLLLGPMLGLRAGRGRPHLLGRGHGR